MSVPTWRSLLQEKEKVLKEFATSQGYGVPEGQMNEHMCQSKFEDFYKEFKLKPGTTRCIRLMNKFFNSFLAIQAISDAIRQYSSDLEEEDMGRPESLIWKTAHTALEVSTLAFDITFLTIDQIGRQSEASLDELIDLQVEFHEKVPTLAELLSTLKTWPNSTPIQDDLKNVYQIFIQSYMSIIAAYTREIFGWPANFSRRVCVMNC